MTMRPDTVTYSASEKKLSAKSLIGELIIAHRRP